MCFFAEDSVPSVLFLDRFLVSSDLMLVHQGRHLGVLDAGDSTTPRCAETWTC